MTNFRRQYENRIQKFQKFDTEKEKAVMDMFSNLRRYDLSESLFFAMESPDRARAVA